MMNQTPRTVTEITRYLKNRLETDDLLKNIYITGEISNFKKHSRGHFYFTIKDEGAQIAAIMFANYTYALKFIPKDGDKVELKGSISVYEPSGSYSIQVKEMNLSGLGALYQKLEELKKQYEKVGLFDSVHKKPIVKFPKKIGVITSPTGAVINDIKNTINRRYRLVELILYPALVQGPSSSASIAAQINRANELNEVDTLIVGRGGGSIEDLWGFNEEEVVLAIFNSKIPIITAIGHEPDVSIADYVADKIAPTPTAAAELATPDSKELLQSITKAYERIDYNYKEYLRNIQTKLVHLDERIENANPKLQLANKLGDVKKLEADLLKNIKNILAYKKQDVEIIKSRLKTPIELIRNLHERIKYLSLNLTNNMTNKINNYRYQFDVILEKLQGQNPLRYMDKGFGLVKKNSKIINTIKLVEIGDELEVELKDGIARAIVKNKEVK